MYSAIDSNRRKSWLLILFFTGLLALAGWIYGYIVTDAGPTGIIWALAVSIGMTLISWFAGDSLTLWTHGATEVTERSQFPTLWNVVENLTITAGIPQPRIYIIEDDSPNALATGRDPSHASIAVTTGLLWRLEKTELEGVLAHELSHIKNLDVRVMMLVVVLVGTLSIIGSRFMHFGIGRRDRNNPVSEPLFLVGLIFLILSPLVGELIKLAISRRREYLADASGALLTRYPEGLARALEKIRDAAVPLSTASSATNHLWISEPQTESSFTQRLAEIFSTHPPINDRIAKLREMG